MELIFLFLAAVLSGFALILVPLAGTPLAGLATILGLIGIVVVIVFAIAIIFKGVKALLHKW
ncbi:hypothetical protein ACOI1C_15585 [Bacillus sp. DJP31]|uniref:hypothetical protein n=1 Tax=Bacillus sp. DJP31 TaxID=3409789 RepID=UPI003BB5EAE1